MVLFFVRRANSVLFSLQNRSLARIQSLQHHGVGSFFETSVSFFTDIIASYMDPLITFVTQTASWLIPTGFSHTEHGKSTVWFYSVFFNSSVLNMNFQNLARFHIAKFMLREFFFLRKSIIQYYQVRIKERICCNCFFFLLLFFQSPHLQTINLNRSFFL